MPYDPRPVSEGGNMGIGEEFTRAAPKGKFRVVGVDTFDGGDWIVNDFSSKNEATSAANKYGGKMTKMYVYDDKGTCVGEAGRY